VTRPRAVTSRRPPGRVAHLYALLAVDAAGREGVLRRTTPYGTQPWITDDPRLVAWMLAQVAPLYRETPIRVGRFVREEGADVDR